MFETFQRAAFCDVWKATAAEAAYNALLVMTEKIVRKFTIN